MYQGYKDIPSFSKSLMTPSCSFKSSLKRQLFMFPEVNKERNLEGSYPEASVA